MKNYFGYNGEKLFLDADVFGESYDPEYIRFRETQLKKLREGVKPIFTNVAPENMVLYGMPATGKNCSANLIFKEVTEASDNAIVVRINCSVANTSEDVICGIIDELSEGPDQIDGLLSDDLTSQLEEVIASKGKIILLYLNDINHLMIYGHLSSTLYSLSAINKSFPETRISIIATIVDTPRQIGTNLDLDVLNQVEIYFPTYSKDEITSLLTERAERGFRPGVISKELVEIVAGIAYITADVQFGIDLLYGAAKYAEKRNKADIEESDIRMYLQSANELHFDRQIRHLTPVEWEIYTRINSLEDTIIKYFSGGPQSRFDPDKPKRKLLKMITTPDAGSSGQKKENFAILDLLFAVERFSELGIFDAGYI